MCGYPEWDIYSIINKLIAYYRNMDTVSSKSIACEMVVGCLPYNRRETHAFRSQRWRGKVACQTQIWLVLWLSSDLHSSTSHLLLTTVILSLLGKNPGFAGRAWPRLIPLPSCIVVKAKPPSGKFNGGYDDVAPVIRNFPCRLMIWHWKMRFSIVEIVDPWAVPAYGCR